MLIIEDGAGKTIDNRLIADELLGTSTFGFSSALLFTKDPNAHQGSYSLRLNFSPALRCDRKKISLASASYTKGVFQVDKARALDNALKSSEIVDSVNGIKDVIKKAHHKFATGHYPNSSQRVREVSRLYTSISRMCMRYSHLTSVSSSRVDTACTNAYRKLDEMKAYS